MSGITWKNIDSENAEKIKSYYLQNGASERGVKGDYEAWRLSSSDTTVTFYTTGTLFSTESASLDPAVTVAWKFIDGIIGPRYMKPSKELLIGVLANW